ncbi:MAG TPA: 50S ribosomal protein L6 [Candidatus Omnitrophota bacterium]|mgnify:CR=1 FL=1|nr:50S ribosomal protein L6 [Candidatus Omnitrophota bacterium]
MSRIGKTPVQIPKDVKVSITKDKVLLEGPKGKLELVLPSGISVESKESQLLVSRAVDTKQDRANHGTIRSRLENMIVGVTKGHKKELEIQGLGFRVQAQGNKLVFGLGFSHPINFEVPKELKVSTPTQTMIVLEGVDNILVGQTAAQIRSLKPVEPYKGKGIRYVGEFVRRKQGKSVTK